MKHDIIGEIPKSKDLRFIGADKGHVN